MKHQTTRTAPGALHAQGIEGPPHSAHQPLPTPQRIRPFRRSVERPSMGTLLPPSRLFQTPPPRRRRTLNASSRVEVFATSPATTRNHMLRRWEWPPRIVSRSIATGNNAGIDRIDFGGERFRTDHRGPRSVAVRAAVDLDLVARFLTRGGERRLVILLLRSSMFWHVPFFSLRMRRGGRSIAIDSIRLSFQGTKGGGSTFWRRAHTGCC